MTAFQRLKAIVYTSNAGHAKQYAELFGEAIALPVYELKSAKRILPKNCKVVYFGWLMAGRVKGLKEAAKCFDIKALCGVGMAHTGSQIEDIRKGNGIPDQTPVFSLQGGFEIEKLHGVHRLMMSTMRSTLGKSLANKEERTDEEDEMLDLLINGGDLVDAANLAELEDWYHDFITQG